MLSHQLKINFKISILFIILLAHLIVAEEKTIPGAGALLPIVLPAIGSMLPAIIPGLPNPIAGITPGTLPVPPVSMSHTTSVSASVMEKPFSFSHSGSISTSSGTGHTYANGYASAGVGSQVSTSGSETSSGTQYYSSGLRDLIDLNNRWQQLFAKR